MVAWCLRSFKANINYKKSHYADSKKNSSKIKDIVFAMKNKNYKFTNHGVMSDSSLGDTGGKIILQSL